MQYRFTVTAIYLGMNKFTNPVVHSDDVKVDDYPDKIAIIRGKGFDIIKGKVEEAKRKPCKNEKIGVSLNLDYELWSIL